MTRHRFGGRVARALAFLPMAGCGGNGGTAPPAEEPAFPADYAQSYTMVRDCRFSIPHPSTITVHCSPEAADAYTTGTYPLPEGSVIVKTVYNDPGCSSIRSWSVMQKREANFAPAFGDWYWQEVNSDRVVTTSGVVQSCVGCHSMCTDRDWTCTDP